MCDKSSRSTDVLGREFIDGLISKLSSPKRKRHNLAVDESPTPTKHPRDSFLQSVATELSQIVQSKSSHTTDECPICIENTKISEAVMTPCGHLFCRQCLIEVFQKNAPTSTSKTACPDGLCPVCAKHVPSNRLVILRPSRDNPDNVIPSYLTAPSPDTTPIKTGSPNHFHGAATPRTILQEAVDGSQDSSKIKAVLGELQEVWKLDPGSKVLIFSNFWVFWISFSLAWLPWVFHILDWMANCRLPNVSMF